MRDDGPHYQGGDKKQATQQSPPINRFLRPLGGAGFRPIVCGLFLKPDRRALLYRPPHESSAMM